MSAANIKDIDFTATTSKKKQKDVASSSSLHKQKRHIEPPSTSELDVFYETLNHAQLKPAILKITPPYLDQFIPDSCNASFPALISHMYNPNCLSMDYMSLVKHCEEARKAMKVLNVQPREGFEKSEKKILHLHMS